MSLKRAVFVFWKSCQLFAQNKSHVSPEQFGPFSGEIAATHQRSAFCCFGDFCSSESRSLSLRNSLFIHGGASSWKIRPFFSLSLKKNDAYYSFRNCLACVWCVFTQARPPGPQTPPTSPWPCSLKLPWQRGKWWRWRGVCLYVSSLANANMKPHMHEK